MGNRGVLHNKQRQIVRDSQVRRWIACQLQFRDRHREIMQPGRWTELFFLDEATACAAGHRPCAECRHADYVRFRAAWPGPAASADEIDRALHAERRLGAWQKRTFDADLASLPDGAFVALAAATAWLVQGPALLRWSPSGYTDRRPRPSGRVTVLTPPSILEAFRNGYTAAVHPSAV